jgi:SnoaL-like domain
MVNPPPGKARGRSRLVSEENKALARRFLEKVFNEGNLDAIDELIDPNRAQHDPAMTEELCGIEGARQLVESTAAPSPTFT